MGDDAVGPNANSASSDAGRYEPFVGRAAELDVLRTVWSQARAGSPRVVLVTGPAGVGKTALVRQFVRDAAGARLLQASGDQLESRLPYGLVEQLHHDLGKPGQEPLTVGAELVGLLGDLQAAGAVLIVVDDAQWADQLSLQALTFALRRLYADRVMGVVVARDDATNMPQGFHRIVASERGATVRLGGLDVAGLIELAASLGIARLPQHAAERLHHHTGGNPLYARALLEELDWERWSAAQGPLPAPSSFSVLVLSRLANCAVETQRLVTSAAVLGPQCLLGVAAHLAELSDPLPALEEATDAKLLELTQGGVVQSVRFPHPLIHAAVYYDLGPARRVRLHARAAELLSPPASLDHRVAAAVGHDPQLSDDLAAYAGQEEARGAFASAAARLETAARLNPSRPARQRLLCSAVELLIRGGEVTEASARIDQVVALPDSARRRAVLGRLALLSGRHREAEQLLGEAWDRSDHEQEADVAAQAGALLARLLLADLRATEAVMWAQRVRALGTDDPYAAGVALAVLIAGLTFLGCASEGLALAAKLPVATPGLPPQALDGLIARGMVRLWTDDLWGAHDDLTTVADPRGSWRVVQLLCLPYLAEAEHRLGAWDDSLAHAEQAVSLATDTDSYWILPLVHAAAAPVLAARGEWEAAHAHARAAVRAGPERAGALAVAHTATATAWVAFAQGDHTGVIEAVRPILALDNREGLDEPGVLPWQELYIDALVSLGRLNEAEAALAPYEALASARARRSSMANAARVRGNLEAARGNLGGARAAFEAGVRHLDSLPLPSHRALLTDAYGRFLRRAGERRAAATQLGAARAIYANLRAQPFLERCVRELAACGLSPARRQPETRRTLTPQELAVARLVATGLTNRQVASELVISAKTVEYHLGNIYTKLALTSRIQLAAHMAQAGAYKR